MVATYPNLDTFLINPKLSLFAFHLCKELTQDKTSDSEDLWLRCAEVGSLLDIPEIESLPQLISSSQSKKKRINNNGQIIWLLLREFHFTAGLLLLRDLARKESQDSLPLSTLQEKFTELLSQSLITFCRLATDKFPNRPGGIYPFKIHDTNAVDFTISCQSDSLTVSQLQNLNPQGCFLPSYINASLGQTLLLFDRRMTSTERGAEIAQASIESFVTASDKNYPVPKLIGKGKFFGSEIYEFENDRFDPAQRLHFLVWIATTPETIAQEDPGSYCVPLYYLLCSRHKIQFVYHQARQSYKQARRLYGEIEPVINNFSQLKTQQNQWLKAELEEIKVNTRDRSLQAQIELLLYNPELALSDRLEEYLQKVSNKRIEAILRQSQQQRLQKLENWLIQIPQKSVDYARCLRDLQTNLTTIAINARNYEIKLKCLQDLALPHDDLGFLAAFLEDDCSQYREQIGYDLEYLTSGKELFDRTIDSIRGLVAIDAQKQQLAEDMAEDERDRRIELWVTVVGSGLAVSALTSAVMPELVQPFLEYRQVKYQQTWYGNQASLLTINVLLHSAIGILAAIMVAVVFRGAIESFLKFLGDRIRQR